MNNVDEDIIAAFQADHPAEAEALFQEGVQAERARILNLLRLANPTNSTLINKAIADGTEPTEIFNASFRAHERAAAGYEPTMPKSTAQPQTPRTPQIQAQQRAATVEEREFGQTLKRRLDLERAYQLRGRARREAIARATTP